MGKEFQVSYKGRPQMDISELPGDVELWLRHPLGGVSFRGDAEFLGELLEKLNSLSRRAWGQDEVYLARDYVEGS